MQSPGNAILDHLSIACDGPRFAPLTVNCIDIIPTLIKAVLKSGLFIFYFCMMACGENVTGTTAFVKGIPTIIKNNSQLLDYLPHKFEFHSNLLMKSIESSTINKMDNFSLRNKTRFREIYKGSNQQVKKSDIDDYPHKSDFDDFNIPSSSLPTTNSESINLLGRAQLFPSFISRTGRFVRQSHTTTSAYSKISKSKQESLQTLYSQLEVIRPCNRTIDSPLLQLLLREATKELEHNITLYLKFFQFSSIPVHLMQLDALVHNGIITDNPAIMPPNKSSPTFVLKLLCKPTPKWTPIIVFPTQLPNSFLQVQVTDHAKLNVCSLSTCSSKCSYTVHNHLQIYARSCCSEGETSGSKLYYGFSEEQLCREDLRQFKRIFYGISFIAAFISMAIIPVIIRERIQQQHEARGWSLMEPFFFGAALLYLIPLLDWYDAENNSCCIAVWLRIIGFTLFYGSILLKIFRNLQEYRVRKAHHVIVREQDLLKYLIVGLLVSFLALFVWTVSSAKNEELWESSWPQCPMDGTAQMWAACELITLLYAMRLCYKARSSSWVERYQFTLAICLEAIVTLTVNLIRYSLRNAGSNDALFIVNVIHLHFTVSLNIAAIIVPKFLLNSESTRRTLAMSGGGSGGRAHPSLAKLRDNLVNGTIDFADIPITEMNAEDIRAELKRVYTQLRMYKLKNIYQENPHISKRKGGGKKAIDKTTSKNRRISIPPQNSNASTNSPKVRRLEEMTGIAIGGVGVAPSPATDDEKSDLTVESAPYNFYLSTINKTRFLDSANSDQSSSVRV